MKVAIYTRVSTEDQHNAVQVEALKAWIVARGHEIGEVYEDTISGTKRDRPAMDRLLAECSTNHIEAVAVVKLDRLARSVSHLLKLSADFASTSTELLIKDQDLDTSTPAGRLLFTMLGAIAEFEADLIRERTKAGMDYARSQGVKLGRPKVVELTRVDAQVLVENHGSQRAAAEALGVSRGVITRALAQPLAMH